MHHLISQPAMERYRTECSIRYAGIIYLLILNRISCGFTREELAFLMGQEGNYIKAMEELQIPVGDLENMVHLNWVFNQRKIDISTFDHSTNYPFELSIWEEQGIRYYQMEYVINTVETVVFFYLMEEIGGRVPEPGRIGIERIAVKKLLNKLLAMNHFKKYRTALQLWRWVEKQIDERIRVSSLMEELELMVGKKGAAPLRKSKAKSFGYRYIQYK